jgi:hypothetical protein
MVVMTPVATSACATVAASAPDRLREILQVRQLTGLGSAGEVGRELRELARDAGIALPLNRLRLALQIGADLCRKLLIFGWVRLLKFLQRADQLCERREPAAVGLGRRRARSIGWGGCAPSRPPSDALESTGQGLLQIRAGQITYGTRTHNTLIGMRG